MSISPSLNHGRKTQRETSHNEHFRNKSWWPHYCLGMVAPLPGQSWLLTLLPTEDGGWDKYSEVDCSQDKNYNEYTGVNNKGMALCWPWHQNNLTKVWKIKLCEQDEQISLVCLYWGKLYTVASMSLPSQLLMFSTWVMRLRCSRPSPHILASFATLAQRINTLYEAVLTLFKENVDILVVKCFTPI